MTESKDVARIFFRRVHLAKVPPLYKAAEQEEVSKVEVKGTGVAWEWSTFNRAFQADMPVMRYAGSSSRR